MPNLHHIRQPSLFSPLTPPGTIELNLPESLRRKESGMAQALWSAEPWRVRAERWLQMRTEPFTSEALVAAIGLPSGTVGVNRNNATGSLMSHWSRRKLIRRVGYTPSKRPESHGALLAVWEPTGRSTAA